MKVHLIFAPATFTLNYGDLGKGTDPPLGILYLASYLRKYGPPGVEIKVTDGLMEGYKKTFDKILAESADIIGISAVTPTVLGAYRLVADIKKRLPHSKVVLGGPHPTAMPQEAFRQKAMPDAVAVGEGEVTFTDLVSLYHSRGNLSPDNLAAIDGLCLFLGDKTVLTGVRRFIRDLDSIPYPARDLIDMTRYTGYPVSKARPATTLLISRGCPFDCTFCSNNIWRSSVPHYRKRSVKNVIGELEELTTNGGFKEFFDNSDEFNTDIVYAKDLLREIISRKLPLHLKCQIRAKPMDEELAQLMKDAGIWYVHLGIESGNEETLRGIKKKVTLQEVEQCCRIVKKYGIKIWGLFMYFNVWEKDGKLCYENCEESMNTLKYAKKLYDNRLIDYFGGSITTPFPGSELWDIAVRHCLIKEECKDAYDMWFYKRDAKLVSRLPGIPEANIFAVHQKTAKYIIKSMLLGHLIRLDNVGFSLLRGFYFTKRQIGMAVKAFCRTFRFR